VSRQTAGQIFRYRALLLYDISLSETLIYGEKIHAVGYTATNPRNKQLLNSDLPLSIHIFISAVSSCLFLLPKLSLEVCILSIKIILAISAGCETLFPALELLIIIVQC